MLMETIISKLTSMKQIQIIPLMKYTDFALPFTIQTIFQWREEQQEANALPPNNEYYETSWPKKGTRKLYADTTASKRSGFKFIFQFHLIHKCDWLLLYKEMNVDMKSQRI